MISKAFMTVLFTGFIAGIIVTGVQMLKVTPLILQAETYELDEVAIKHTHTTSGIEHEHNLNGVTLDNHLKVKDVHDVQRETMQHKETAVHWSETRSEEGIKTPVAFVSLGMYR